jgi:PAS domain S-box-containing protein
LQDALAGREVTYEAVRQTTDAGARDVQVTNVPNFGADGLVEGIFVLVTDVTDIKQRERDLRESQHSLAEAQRVGRMGHWRIDNHTGEIIWSDELYRIFGVDRDTFTPTLATLVALTHPDDRARVHDLRQAEPGMDEAFNIEYRIIRPDGEIRVINGQGRPQFDGQGNFVSIFGIAQDITERQQAEVALAERNRLLQATINAWPGSVSLRDADGRIVLISDHLADLFGRSPEDFIGHTLHEALGEVDAETVDELVAKVIETGQPILDMEREPPRFPGRWFIQDT